MIPTLYLSVLMYDQTAGSQTQIDNVYLPPGSLALRKYDQTAGSRTQISTEY